MRPTEEGNDTPAGMCHFPGPTPAWIRTPKPCGKSWATPARPTEMTN